MKNFEEIMSERKNRIEARKDELIRRSLLSEEFLEMIQKNKRPFDLLMSYYQCAVMEIETKFRVLNQEYSLEYDKNPIEGIKTRIKSYDSIVRKIRRKNIPMSLTAIEENIKDIAGVRVICSFPEDIYELADSFLRQDDIVLIEKKDYIKNPKPSGYRSLHLIVQVPIFLQKNKKMVNVEVQFRTIAMDFWASLEHKIYYKFEGHAPEYISRDLRACAEIVSNLDAKMLQLNEAILEEKEKEAVKANVINLLKQYYDMEEEDFLSAELEIVPAGKARDCGLDRSMVLAYGQDDRVCAFTSLFAMLDVEEVEHTACCILVDKEEIGSVGATGMHSRFFENTVAELVALTEGESDLKVRRALMNSRMLSSDVSAAYDPMYAEVFEKRSSAFFGKGLVFNKFTGARGKSGSNDANAEYLANIRNAMDAQSVAYQFAELGKVDAGGGGTIAYIMANYGMEVIDSGVAVLSMHAPWEVTSKADVYEAYKGYKAFVEEMR